MSYTPFEPRIFPLYIFYIILLVAVCLLAIKMYIKWRERKVKPPLFLFLVFTFLTIAVVMLIIGLTEAVITGYFKEIYRFTFPLAFCCVVIADIFLFIFSSHMTNKGQKAFIPIIIIGAILIIILLLPWNWWGIPSKDIGNKPYIRLYSTLAFVIYSISIYVTIMLLCQKARKVSSDNIVKLGLLLLFYATFSMILFFVFLMIDNLLITLINHPGYSEFLYIGWSFTLIFVILSYLSLIMPKWLINLIEKKIHK